MKILIFILTLAFFQSAYAISCKDFATHAQAQAYFNAKKPGYKKLDGDQDGKACVCLPGGNGEKCPKRW